MFACRHVFSFKGGSDWDVWIGIIQYNFTKTATFVNIVVLCMRVNLTRFTLMSLQY